MLLVRSTLLAATPLQLNSALAPSARPRGGRVALVSTSPLLGDREEPVSWLFNATGWGSDDSTAFTYLKAHQPAMDATSMSDDVLRTGVRLAMQARRTTPWAQAVPWEVFVENVLPYAVLHEARDNWRPLFYEMFMPLVANASNTTEAALRLNAHMWDMLGGVKYEAQLSPHITSPLEAVAYKRASCTGLSVLLVDACRAVGVPARMAAVGAWAPPATGNHNWVEIWVDDHWEFTGAFDGDRQMLNKTWFTSQVKGQDASVAEQRVYAVTWQLEAGGVPLPEACVSTGGNEQINAIDRTAYYNQVVPPGEDYKEGTEGGVDDDGPLR